MPEAELTPEMVDSQNDALRVLRDRVNELGPVNACTYPTGRSRRSQLMLVVERLRVDVRAEGTEPEWVYVVGPTVIGSSTDPVDAAVRLLHLIATRQTDGTANATLLDRATVFSATAAIEAEGRSAS